MSRRSSKQGPIPDDLSQLVEDLDDLFERVSKLEAPSGESLGNTLSKARDNIAELQARYMSVSEEVFNQVVSVGDAIPADTPWLSTISFVVDARRLVRLQSSMYVGMVISSNGSGPTADLWGQVLLRQRITNVDTGTTNDSSTSASCGAAFNAGARSLARRADRITHEDFALLVPGNYTYACSATVSRLDGQAGSVTLQSAKTSVQMLERR